MKKATILLILFTALFTGLKSSSQVAKYEVIGNVEGAGGMKFVLQQLSEKGVVKADTAVAVNGHFEFSGSVDYPVQANLTFLKKSNSQRPGRRPDFPGRPVIFFLENSKITIAGQYDSLSYSIKNLSITGSKSHDEFLQFNPEQNKPVANRRFLSPRSPGFASYMDSLEVTQKAMAKDFIRKFPGSYVVPSVLSSFCIISGVSVEEVDSLINQLDPEIVKLPEVSEIKTKIDKLKTDAVRGPDKEQQKLWVQEVNEKASPGGKDLIMKFEETERHDNYSIVRVTYTSGASVASAMFPMQGEYNIARLRGKQFFITLKSWKDPEGRGMYKVGFCNSRDIDLKKEFGDDIDPEATRLRFSSVLGCLMMFGW